MGDSDSRLHWNVSQSPPVCTGKRVRLRLIMHNQDYYFSSSLFFFLSLPSSLSSSFSLSLLNSFHSSHPLYLSLPPSPPSSLPPSLPPFSSLSLHACSDLNLDTKLELLKNRDTFEYLFKTLPDMKDGRYKGQWKNSKPFGRLG